MPVPRVSAVFSIDPVEAIDGRLPRRQTRLVKAWAELHQDEILADWEQLLKESCPNVLTRCHEHMSHPIHRVEAFTVVGDYTLRVRFEDATEQVIDFLPILAGALYAPLRDLAVFNQVHIDSEVHTLA
jgi:hypothetical protein